MVCYGIILEWSTGPLVKASFHISNRPWIPCDAYTSNCIFSAGEGGFGQKKN